VTSYRDDEERAAVRESVLARSVRSAVTEHLRILLAAGWRREQVEELARQSLDDAARAQIMRRGQSNA
jgi:hypothetical protein